HRKKGMRWASAHYQGDLTVAIAQIAQENGGCFTAAVRLLRWTCQHGAAQAMTLRGLKPVLIALHVLTLARIPAVSG
ncbi:MAG TPA: hypothetical protein VF797_01135, partial [Noviherbaspirillum sp.]